MTAKAKWRTRVIGRLYVVLTKNTSTTDTALFVELLRLHEFKQDGRSSVLRFGTFRTACIPRHFLAATSSFDHGHRFQTTETSGERPLLDGCSQQGHESRQGDLERGTSEGHFWLRWHPSNNNQGTFPPILLR